MGDSPEGKITALFDQLTAEGVLIYGPHESVVHEADGYPVSV